MYASDEHLREKEKACEYPPRFKITCEQYGGILNALPNYVVSKKLKNSNTEEIGSFPLYKCAAGI